MIFILLTCYIMLGQSHMTSHCSSFTKSKIRTEEKRDRKIRKSKKDLNKRREMKNKQVHHL